MPSSPRVRIAALIAVSMVVVTACSGRDDGTSASTVPIPTFDVTTTVATTTAPPSSTVPTTEGAAETTVPETAPTTVATTVAPTTTTEPVAVQELLLRGDGIGSARFGAAPEGVIEYVTSILGGNTGDTGWVDPLTFAVCDGTVARRVDWGVLSLLFSDLSDVADGRRHFMGYEYGRDGQVGDEPIGLRTAGGTTLGSRVVDLLADFPDASVNPGEADIDIPDNFYVSNNFYGLLTGTDPEDVVTVIFGGFGCGA
ncbi:MAG: hypothetical protein R8G01_07200 [Ilumatobacteraceae bacterium]|nr:hypothetical protein [Ilumatobacteraceae bacterium]